MSFDRHMNIVLGDCEEYRKIPAKKGKGGDQPALDFGQRAVAATDITNLSPPQVKSVRRRGCWVSCSFVGRTWSRSL